MTLFFDTNVLLDAVLDRPPFAQEAGELWVLTEVGRMRGFISAISFNNTEYVVRKTRGRDEAREAARALRDTFECVPLDVEILDQAIASDMNDFEDAIQYCSALRIQPDYFVTRNQRDFPSPPLRVISPADLLALPGFPFAQPSP